MPLRRFLPLLFVTACASGQAEPERLHWMSADAIQALPVELRPALKPWCEGTWFNPLFAQPAETTDTVITAAESSLTPNGLVMLSGDVQIQQPDRHLSAGHAELDQASGDFVMRDGIRVDTPAFSLQAEEFRGNTRNRQASLTGTRYALFDLPARGQADAMEQQDAQVIIRRGSYTSCPPDSNAWLLSAAQIDLDRDKGWGEAEDVVLRVHRVPVLYVPWMTFPIDDRRKTGLLFPSISSSSENGVDITQPVYLNLHPQADATVAPRYVENRGQGGELEGRYLVRAGEGSISYAGLHQDRLFNDEDREVARWQHLASTGDWLFRSDVNYVSDDFYFKDLDTGLDISSRTHLPREGEARYLGRHWQLLGRVQSYQTIDPNLADADLPYRRLPQLAARGNQRIFGPLHLDFSGDYTRFDRSADLLVDDITGERSHLRPGVELHWRNDWGYLVPAARYYATRYRLDGVDTLPEDDPTREILGANLRAGLFLERPTGFFDHALMQTLEPQLLVNYIDFEDQSGLPVFDSSRRTLSWQTLFEENRFNGLDRIGDDHSVTAGLTSRWISLADGQERLTLRSAQRHYRRDRQVQLPGETLETDTLSPLVTDATMRLGNRYSLFVENQWNSQANQRVANRARLSYSGEQAYYHAGLVHRDQDGIRQGELAALVPVHQHWRLFGRWLYDVEGSRSLETLAGAEYRNCCWRMSLINQRELTDRDGDGDLEADNTILFQIQLTGLGGFGDKLDTLLRRSLPEYRSDND